MSTWIAWPPDDPSAKLPNAIGDPLNQFQPGYETESCPKCSFSVRFISDRDQYELWNDHSHSVIAGFLRHQAEIGECPTHPKPNWIV